MDQEQLPELPIIREECPKCGCKTRLIQEYTNKLKKDGKIPSDYMKDEPSYSTGIIQQLPMIDPNHPPKILGPSMKVNVIISSQDYCAKCLEYYCSYFNIVEMPAQFHPGPVSQINPGSIPGMSPGPFKQN